MSAKRRRKENSTRKRKIESYEHRDKERLNNPPVGLVTPQTDPDIGQQKRRYSYDPHLDPQLVWAGKAERTSFEVPTVSLHVHERIEPRTIIEAVRKPNNNGRVVQLSLFEQEREEPLRQAIEFYRHKHGWTNRLIAGDSLLVMNSLLEKEGMAGKVQMIYIDPPYGIKYGSNFQPFVNKRDVQDGRDEDLTAEPEQLKAFRDTWELGIHSYLSYLRDRLLLAGELLHESGSIFVQMGDENVHLVRCLLDEVFGPSNFMSLISFRTKIPLNPAHLPNIADYLIWYAKDKRRVKFRRLYVPRQFGADTQFFYVLLPTGEIVHADNVPPKFAKSARYFSLIDLMSAGYGQSCHFDFYLEGRRAHPNPTTSWKTTLQGMTRLMYAGRVRWVKTVPRYVFFADDYPVMEITNQWSDTQGPSGKVYVVQTAEKIVERCILMATDPGDLVFDPTCGSGTTAYVAEKWGRRWITCDTSRVALAIARQRVMTAVFEYYELAQREEGVGSGFKYKTVPHVTLGSIANNPEIDTIYERMHPAVERALAELNAALKGRPVKFKVTQGGREGHFVDFAAPDTATFTMPSGQVVKVNELVEWEVPFEFPADWPEDARPAFDRFHKARREMQKAIDEAIARHADQEVLYDQPLVDTTKVRVTGPFTVEAVPAPVVKSVDELLPQYSSGQGQTSAEPSTSEIQEPCGTYVVRKGQTLRQEEWRGELLKTGIRGKGGQRIHFTRLEPLPACRWLHAVGETRPLESEKASAEEQGPSSQVMRVVVSFGPEYAPLEQRQVQGAWEEARMLDPKPQLLIFAAFQFDPEAAKDIDEMKPELAGMQFLKVQMNADLLTEDLKKKRASNESFWLIGQPDVEVRRHDDEHYVVEVHGFDYYNTRTGQIESGGKDKIALWMLDTDYDGRSLYPRQVFFPMAGPNDGWAKLARTLKAEIDQELIEAYRGTVSLPFKPGKYRRIAVKIVDDRGIESLRVLELER